MKRHHVRYVSVSLALGASLLACHATPADPPPPPTDASVIADFTVAVARLDSLTSLPIYDFSSGFRNSMLPLAPGQVGIPDTLLGRTFTWDSAGKRYLLSSLSGAPADGTRFLLYAFQLNAIGMGGPNTEQDIGQVDVRYDTLGAILHTQVVADSVTYLAFPATRFDSGAWSGINALGTIVDPLHTYVFGVHAADSARVYNDALTETISDSTGGWYLTFTFGNADKTWAYELAHNGHAVRYAGTVTTGGEMMTLTIDDSAIATVSSGVGGPLSILPVGNRQLTSAEIAFAKQLDASLASTWSLGFVLANDAGAYLNVAF